MFAAEYEPAEVKGRRLVPRTPVSLDADVEARGLTKALCKVIDLSIRGARLQTYTMLEPGLMIWLNIPRLGIGEFAARVTWADEFEAGCRFERRLPKAEFERLVPPVKNIFYLARQE